MSNSEKNREIFNEALTKFFAHRPLNPYWALIVLYLRKIHQIEIVENYSGDPVDVIATVADENDITDYEWNYREAAVNGMRSLSVIGNLSSNERLRHIFSVFEEDARSRSLDRPVIISTVRKQWKPIFLLEFVSSIIKLDDEWLEKNFNELFDRVVQRIFYLERYDIYSQPFELTQLIEHLIGSEVEKVYDPFAGVASFALAVPKGAKYIGEEINPLVAAIGNLRIMANDIEGEVLNESSVNCRDFDADIIVSTPPFHLPVKSEELPGGEDYGLKNDASSFLMKKCLFAGKRGIITTTGSFNFSPTLRDCRKLLVDADFIDIIISLPPNIFDRTGVKTCIYVLNPRHTHKGMVRLVNADNIYTASDRKNILKVNEILQLVNNPGDNNIDISIEAIKANNYFLAPEFYLKPQIQVPEGATLMRLSELVRHVPPKRMRHERKRLEGEMLNLRNQDNTNHLKIYRPGNGFIPQELPAVVNEIDQNCILIPPLMNMWKGIMVEPEGKTLFAPTSWKQFVIKDKNIVLPQYLVLQFYQNYFEKQIISSSINFSHSMLLNAYVVVPSLERQMKEIERYQENLIGELGLELVAEKGRKVDLLAKEMRIRRHTLLNAMQGIVSGMSVLKSFIDNRNEPFEKTDIVAPRKQMSMETLVNRVNCNLDRVVNLITDLIDLGDYDPAEEINISDFCNEYEKRYVDTNNFEIVWPNNKDVEHGLVDIENLNVSFSRKELYTVFDNIISNAYKHGFYDRENGNNVIRVEFEPVVNNDTEYVSIRFLNNGIPLEPTVSSSMIFEWGRKSSRSRGAGVGGWHIRQIVEHYGGQVEVSNLENDERGFTVMYEIKLPATITKI